jgi:hypothetical protein
MNTVNTEGLNLGLAQAMLEHLFFGADCFIRFLYLKERNAVERYFRPVEIDSQAFRDEIEARIVDGWNIFYSICGRRDKSGKLEDVSVIPALWVDLDAKDFEDGMEEASKQFYKLPASTYIVNSGHGYHGVWALKQRVEANDENNQKVASILRGLAKATNGDAVYDLSRMLRLPETINFKDSDKPVACHIVFMSSVEYVLDDFSQYAVETRQDKVEDITFANELLPPLDVSTLRVSDKIKELIKSPPKEGERSEAVYAVVKSLQKAGYTPDEVLAVIVNNPLGNRYDE